MSEVWERGGPRNHRVRHVRIADELWHKFEERAALAGMTNSSYLRLLIAVDAGVTLPPPWFKPLGPERDDIFKRIERELDRRS